MYQHTFVISKSEYSIFPTHLWVKKVQSSTNSDQDCNFNTKFYNKLEPHT